MLSRLPLSLRWRSSLPPAFFTPTAFASHQTFFHPHPYPSHSSSSDLGSSRTVDGCDAGVIGGGVSSPGAGWFIGGGARSQRREGRSYSVGSSGGGKRVKGVSKKDKAKQKRPSSSSSSPSEEQNSSSSSPQQPIEQRGTTGGPTTSSTTSSSGIGSGVGGAASSSETTSEGATGGGGISGGNGNDKGGKKKEDKSLLSNKPSTKETTQRLSSSSATAKSADDAALVDASTSSRKATSTSTATASRRRRRHARGRRSQSPPSIKALQPIDETDGHTSSSSSKLPPTPPNPNSRFNDFFSPSSSTPFSSSRSPPNTTTINQIPDPSPTSARPSLPAHLSHHSLPTPPPRFSPPPPKLHPPHASPDLISLDKFFSQGRPLLELVVDPQERKKASTGEEARRERAKREENEKVWKLGRELVAGETEGGNVQKQTRSKKQPKTNVASNDEWVDMEEPTPTKTRGRNNSRRKNNGTGGGQGDGIDIYRIDVHVLNSSGEPITTTSISPSMMMNNGSTDTTTTDQQGQQQSPGRTAIESILGSGDGNQQQQDLIKALLSRHGGNNNNSSSDINLSDIFSSSPENQKRLGELFGSEREMEMQQFANPNGTVTEQQQEAASREEEEELDEEFNEEDDEEVDNSKRLSAYTQQRSSFARGRLGLLRDAEAEASSFSSPSSEEEEPTTTAAESSKNLGTRDPMEVYLISEPDGIDPKWAKGTSRWLAGCTPFEPPKRGDRVNVVLPQKLKGRNFLDGSSELTPSAQSSLSYLTPFGIGSSSSFNPNTPTPSIGAFFGGVGGPHAQIPQTLSNAIQSFFNSGSNPPEMSTTILGGGQSSNGIKLQMMNQASSSASTSSSSPSSSASSTSKISTRPPPLPDLDQDPQTLHSEAARFLHSAMMKQHWGDAVKWDGVEKKMQKGMKVYQESSPSDGGANDVASARRNTPNSKDLVLELSSEVKEAQKAEADKSLETMLKEVEEAAVKADQEWKLETERRNNNLRSTVYATDGSSADVDGDGVMDQSQSRKHRERSWNRFRSTKVNPWYRPAGTTTGPATTRMNDSKDVGSSSSPDSSPDGIVSLFKQLLSQLTGMDTRTGAGASASGGGGTPGMGMAFQTGRGDWQIVPLGGTGGGSFGGMGMGMSSMTKGGSLSEELRKLGELDMYKEEDREKLAKFLRGRFGQEEEDERREYHSEGATSGGRGVDMLMGPRNSISPCRKGLRSSRARQIRMRVMMDSVKRKRKKKMTKHKYKKRRKILRRKQ